MKIIPMSHTCVMDRSTYTLYRCLDMVIVYQIKLIHALNDISLQFKLFGYYTSRSTSDRLA